MLEAGLTPMQAITVATSNSAALLKLDDRGVLAVGKLADLVVLDGDPTADISNTKKIHAVWHRGKKAAGPIETSLPRFSACHETCVHVEVRKVIRQGSTDSSRSGRRE